MQKGALNDVGLYRLITLMAACMNVPYGSIMSPPRQVQIKEAVEHHFEVHSHHSDHWFQYWLPMMLSQLQTYTGINPSSLTAAEEMHGHCRGSIFVEDRIGVQKLKLQCRLEDFFGHLCYMFCFQGPNWCSL